MQYTDLESELPRVLVVDDNPGIHEDFRKILAPEESSEDSARLASIDAMEAEILGGTAVAVVPRQLFAVDFASRGQDAVAMVVSAFEEGRPYSMAFVDMRMPNGWDGLETIAHAWEQDPDLQVVICTAYSHHALEEIDERLGSRDRLLILKKPFDDVEILQMAKTLCRKRLAESVLRNQASVLEQQVMTIRRLGREQNLLLESTGEGIYGVDRRGCCIFINKAGASMLGFSPDELMNRNMHEMIHHHRPDGSPYPVEECRIYCAHSTGQFCRADDEVFWSRDGVAIPVEYSAFPILSGKDVTGTVVTFKDITERLQMTQELRIAKDSADTANRAKSAFLAHMSHELRTPLNGVIGMTNLLKQTKLDDTQAQYVKMARSASDALLSVISNILDLSKIETGNVVVKPVDFTLKHLLQESMDVVSPMATAKNLELSVATDISLPECLRGDADRLRQILINLLNNAIKFTETGGIRLHVGQITSSEPKSGGSASPVMLLKFSVTDTGPGIEADQQNRLFKAFSQLEDSQARSKGGTGLGLAICRELAELMGGTVGVESKVGAGSTFWFTARLTQASSIALKNASTDVATNAVYPPAGIRILLADDDRMNQLVASAYLSDVGYAFDVVSDGNAAAIGAGTGNYDLVLMDCQMPGTDGYQGVEAIRTADYTARKNPEKRLPVIALTANATAGDREVCIQAGFDDYLTKPMEPADLYRVIARALIAVESKSS